MRFRIKKYDEHAELWDMQFKYCNWHDWFAWFPVRISEDEIAWLETVERKADWIGTDIHWFLVHSLEDCKYREKRQWKDKLL